MCDVIYLDPAPSPQDLDVLYRGAPQFTGMHYAGIVEAQRILDGYGRRLDALDLLPGPHESILEVGAGLAWMSGACKERLKSVRTIAQDISKECVGMCPWVDEYLILPIENLPQHAQFRLISMTHVIEHTSDPARILKQLGVYAMGGGHVYITAPFRPPLWRTEDGFSPWLTYSYLHVPAHISYLSKKWFMEFGPKAGFDLVHWDDSHDGHQVFEAVLRKNSGIPIN
jgi:SAM-dependent methyltransferase